MVKKASVVKGKGWTTSNIDAWPAKSVLFHDSHGIRDRRIIFAAQMRVSGIVLKFENGME